MISHMTTVAPPVPTEVLIYTLYVLAHILHICTCTYMESYGAGLRHMHACTQWWKRLTVKAPSNQPMLTHKVNIAAFVCVCLSCVSFKTGAVTYLWCQSMLLPSVQHLQQASSAGTYVVLGTCTLISLPAIQSVHFTVQVFLWSYMIIAILYSVCVIYVCVCSSPGCLKGGVSELLHFTHIMHVPMYMNWFMVSLDCVYNHVWMQLGH